MTDKAYIETVDIEFHVADDVEDFAESVARSFVTLSKDCIQKRGKFTVALSGGNTPASVMDVLARKYKNECEWDLIHFFWSDERYVSSDHERSNYNMSYTHLLKKVSIPNTNIHRVLTEYSLSEAVHMYNQTLNDFFSLKDDDLPVFDLVLLGLGDDGHTASLFPHQPSLNDNDHFVAIVPDQKEPRITFTYQLINAALNVFVLIYGESKQKVVKASLYSPVDYQKIPIQGVHPDHGKLFWFMDRAAAGSLK